MKEKPPKISVTGIDGSGKDFAVDWAIDKSIDEGKFKSLGRMGNPNYFAVGDGRLTIDSGSELVERLRSRADTTSKRGLILAANGLHLANQARMIYPKLARQNPDAIVGSRELVVDPLVYGRHYGGKRLGSMALRGMGLLAKSVGHKSDMIIWLDTEPDIALARTEQRASKGVVEQPHENVSDLQRLRENYADTIDYYREKIHEVPLVNINTTNMDKEGVGDMVAKSIQAFQSKDLGGADWEIVA